ncbi:MAG: methyl-accepting chemotaxis protein, partial [Ruminococcus sp.]|nr:methyl-accepting chemotaxis protein [Ruminococcus sp.]
ILGFNASIEASRAKESGKGFGVIAQEVRNLADVSKASADKIEDTIKTILDFTSDINNNISELEEMIEKNEQNLNEIKKFLAELRGNASN